MFGIGGFELFLILLFGFLIFGPDKLPAMAKTLGKAIAKFRDAQEEMNKVIKTEVYDPNSDEPFKNPLDALAKVGEIGKDDKKEAPAASGKQESFSERKARYDKERAAKKAEEAKPVSTAATGASPAKAEAAKPVTEPKAKPSADELYGTKPAAKKPAAKPATKSAAASGEKKTSATTARKTSAAKPAKTEAEKAAARSAAAKKAAATRAAKKKAAEEAAKAAPTTTNEKGE